MIALIRLDALSLRRDRLALAILVIGSLACLLAAIAGHDWRQRLDGHRAAAIADAATAFERDRERWAKAATLPPEEAVLLPQRLGQTLVLASPTLADFSIGRSALEPVAATARLATRPDALFGRYEIENPERLFRGALDLAFIVVVLAPLLLIGLGHNVVTGDRDRGTERLWLAQAGSPLRLVAARSINRLALVCAPVVVAALGLWLAGPAGRGGAIALWLAVGFVGLLFWWAVILLANAMARTAETAALALVALWAMLVFAVPSAATTAGQLLDPAPSRFEQIAVARAAEVKASREYDDDHPELSATTLEGRRANVEKGIVVRRQIAAAVAPIQRDFAKSRAAQERLADRLALLSPPAMTANALAAIAATDAAFFARQRDAAAAHLTPLSGALIAIALGDQPVGSASFRALPRFTPPAPAAPHLLPVLWIGFLTLAFGLLALRLLRRSRPV